VLFGFLAGVYALTLCHLVLATWGTGLTAVTAVVVSLAAGMELGWKPPVFCGERHTTAHRRFAGLPLFLAAWIVALPSGLQGAMALAGRIPLEVMAAPGRLLVFECLAAFVLLLPAAFWLARWPWWVSRWAQQTDTGTGSPRQPTDSEGTSACEATTRTSRPAVRDRRLETLLLLCRPFQRVWHRWRQFRQEAANRPVQDVLLPRYLAGIALGLLADVFLLAPLMGVHTAGLVAAGVSGLLFLVSVVRSLRNVPSAVETHSAPAGETERGDGQSIREEEPFPNNRESVSSKSVSAVARFNSVVGRFNSVRLHRLAGLLWNSATLASLGAMLAVLLRMLQQLAPAAGYFVYLQWVGLLLGTGWGIRWGLALPGERGPDSRVRGPSAFITPSPPAPLRRERGVLWVSAAAAVMLAGYPLLIAASLWLNVYVAQPWLLMAAQGVLLTAVLGPVGYGWGRLVAGTSVASDEYQPSKTQARPSTGIGAKSLGSQDASFASLQLFPLAAGYLLMRWVGFALWPSADALVALVWILAVLALVHWLVRGSVEANRDRKEAGWRTARVSQRNCGRYPEAHASGSRDGRGSWCSRWAARALYAAVAAVIVVSPWMRSQYQPLRAARQLFATNVFIAYIKGLDRELLSSLDEGRALEQREGETGTLSLWRYRGTQMQIRENGVPRALVSTRPSVCPQFSAEVMPAVMPLVLHERPRRVMVLGVSGGVGLTTTLSFPVKSVTCVESDAELLRLLRERVWTESRERPEDDLRVRMMELDPAVAVACRSGEYDVIISTPEPSALLKATPYFTREFYQRAARQLSRDGIFCQRFHQVDYGPRPLQTVTKTLQSVFGSVAAIETAGGEMVLLATNSAEGLVRDGLVERFQAPHVRTVLSRVGWDWSLPLNLTALSDDGLKAMRGGTATRVNTASNGAFAFTLSREMMRWGPKWQELAGTIAPHSTRFLAAEGIDGNDPVLLRRLSELTGQRQLMTGLPDQWWAYRKSLKQQLKERPRTLMKAVREGRGTRFHPEDERRFDYLRALEQAIHDPALPAVRKVAAFSQPYDPLLSYFLHHEVAALYERCTPGDPPAELWHRLHAVYYAHPRDRSVRDVFGAMTLLSAHPEAVDRPADCWDHLNALLQILKTRWETRGLVAPRSPQIVLNDIEESLEAAEQAFSVMSELRPAIGVPADHWSARQRVLRRGLLRPLRAYRTRLLKHHHFERHRIKEMLQHLERRSRPDSSETDQTDQKETPPEHPSPQSLRPSAN